MTVDENDKEKMNKRKPARVCSGEMSRSSCWPRPTPTPHIFLTGVFLLVWAAPSLVNAALTEADIRRDAVVRAVEEVMPSIVNIGTEILVESSDPLDQLFRDFFGPYYRR